MDERTRAYLAGRFSDHYRRESVDIPPSAHRREWGFIPWASGERTTMVRHRSVTDLGGLDQFLSREGPRHVYYSAGYYDEPSAGSMAAKGWRGSDLVFDLDADHLPGINPAETGYGAMLAACKRELQTLLDLLEADFGFDSYHVVFSGGRGYHVHVRTDDVRSLPQRARRDIAEYVRGENVTMDAIIETSAVQGTGRSTPASTRRLVIGGGWGQRVHRTLIGFANELQELEAGEATAKLQSIEGIGEQRANALYAAIRSSTHELAAGNIDIHPAMMRLLDALIERTVADSGAAIDEPVTTDVHRLIRLPGSLHGGSGLRVCSLDRDTLASFDPLVDAIPETFIGHEIAVRLPEDVRAEVGGESRVLGAGQRRLPEAVAIHLMARGEALKIPESSV